jgi:outer membrane cobalamin receptor
MHFNNNRFNALFVPRFSGASSFKMQRKLWYLNTICQWQSMRYTSTDNLSALPGYALFSMQTGKEIKMKQHAITLSAGADNVFNHSYEVMPGRPMPLRSFWLKVNFQLASKKYKI